MLRTEVHSRLLHAHHGSISHHTESEPGYPDAGCMHLYFCGPTLGYIFSGRWPLLSGGFEGRAADNNNRPYAATTVSIH
jgi:hypothetical protein